MLDNYLLIGIYLIKINDYIINFSVLKIKKFKHAKIVKRNLMKNIRQWGEIFIITKNKGNY